MDERRQFGNRGESDAASYLVGIGYNILESQWRSPFGEVDLICLDKTVSPEEIVFVEVKTRRSLESGYPEDSVTPKKLRHLAACAECYLEEKKWSSRPYRFDAIAISVLPNAPCDFVHLKGV